jgi:hypothetical protein
MRERIERQASDPTSGIVGRGFIRARASALRRALDGPIVAEVIVSLP